MKCKASATMRQLDKCCMGTWRFDSGITLCSSTTSRAPAETPEILPCKWGKHGCYRNHWAYPKAAIIRHNGGRDTHGHSPCKSLGSDRPIYFCCHSPNHCGFIFLESGRQTFFLIEKCWFSSLCTTRTPQNPPSQSRKAIFVRRFIRFSFARHERKFNGPDSPINSLFRMSSAMFLRAVATAHTTLSLSIRSSSTRMGSPFSLRTAARIYTDHCEARGKVQWGGGGHLVQQTLSWIMRMFIRDECSS